MSEADVIAVTEANAALAVALLVRFFSEEGFATPADQIAANLRHMLQTRDRQGLRCKSIAFGGPGSSGPA